MKKLTPKMQEIYDLMKAGAIAYFMPYMGRFNQNAYWFLSGNGHTQCTKQIEGLIARGLLEVVNKDKYSNRRSARVKS